MPFRKRVPCRRQGQRRLNYEGGVEEAGEKRASASEKGDFTKWNCAKEKEESRLGGEKEKVHAFGGKGPLGYETGRFSTIS